MRCPRTTMKTRPRSPQPEKNPSHSEDSAQPKTKNKFFSRRRRNSKAILWMCPRREASGSSNAESLQSNKMTFPDGSWPHPLLGSSLVCLQADIIPRPLGGGRALAPPLPWEYPPTPSWGMNVVGEVDDNFTEHPSPPKPRVLWGGRRKRFCPRIREF